MLSDYRILGIEEGSDPATIKRAYRKRVKELHPDLSTVETVFPRHDLFIEVCKAYRRLMDGKGPQALPLVREGGNRAGGGEISPHADQAYVFYKQGMKAFMSIHPSQWNLDASGMLNTKIAGQEGEQEEVRQKVIELVKLFPRAYYYFSIVAHEYPDSAWADDAREKMGKIEERIGMYRKIADSFLSWNIDEELAVREYRETYGKMNENLKRVRRDMPKNWR